MFILVNHFDTKIRLNLKHIVGYEESSSECNRLNSAISLSNGTVLDCNETVEYLDKMLNELSVMIKGL